MQKGGKPPIVQKAQPVTNTQGQSQDFYMLLLGETGSGKSTFLNMLVNFYRGKPEARTAMPAVKDLRLAVPTPFLSATEPEGRLHSESNVKKRSAVQIHVIDTPGLSDTGGPGKDQDHLDHILQTAAQLPFISAIILVANGSVARQTMNIKNVFTLLRGNMPDSVLDNTLAILTNCNSLTRNLDPRVLPLKVPKKHRFCVDNSAFSTDPNRYAEADEDEVAGLNVSWASSMRTLQKVSELVISLSAASSTAFTALKNLKEELKAKMAKSLAELRNMQQLEDAVQQAEVLLQGAALDSEKYKDFMQTSTIEEIEIVDADYHSTLCNVCQSVCHDHCNLNEIADAGDAQFAGCIAMGGPNSTCTRCTGNCSILSHYHARKKVQKTQKTIENILDDVKAKYEAARDQYGGAQATANQALNDLDMIKQVQQEKLDEIKQLCRAIKQIASNFNLTSELNAALAGLDVEAQSLKSTQARENADRVIAEMKSFISQLSEDPSKSVGWAELDMDDGTSDSSHTKPRHVQLDQMQSLASRTPAKGPARQQVLQAAAAEASNVDEFRLKADSKPSQQSSQLDLLSQQMARMQEVLQEVMEYKQLVSTPQRAAATPAAVAMASFTEDRLAAKKLVLLQQLAALEQQQAKGSGMSDSKAWQSQASTFSEGGNQRYDSHGPPMPAMSRGKVVPPVVSNAFANSTLDNYHVPAEMPSTLASMQKLANPVQPHASMPPQELKESQSYSMPSASIVMQQQMGPSLKGDTVPEQYMNARHADFLPAPYGAVSEAKTSQEHSLPIYADALPQTQSKHEVPVTQLQPQQIHASAGMMMHAYASQSTRFVVPANKVSNLVKLVCNNNKLKAQISDATGCSINIPPMEQWDDVGGVTIFIEGRRAAMAVELIADKLE